MNVNFINPFITSTIHTFRTMLNLDVKPGQPKLKTEPFPTYDISGIIGLSRDAKGSIILSFPKTVALNIVSKFLETELKIVGPDVTDGIGELTNIIAGSAKKDLKNMQISISLPTVIVGKNHQVSCPKDTPEVLIPFESPIGNFTLEVSFKTK